MGLRYGLLAALTLVLASALLWDRLNPPQTQRLLPRDVPSAADLALVVIGGAPEPPAAPGGSLAVREDASEGTATEGAFDGPSEEGEVVVEKGDTLGALALRTLGSSRRAAELAAFNGLSLDSPIREGQVLRVPPAAAAPAPAPGRAIAGVPSPAPRAVPAPVTTARRSHRVESGDTLYALAKRYYGDGGKFRRIAEANALDEESPLRAGSSLVIP